LHVASASDIEKVILKLQAGQPDKVVTMPTSLLSVGWKETIGKDFIYSNAPLHVGNKYLCWGVGDGRGDGKIINTRCGPRTAKNRARAALARRISKSMRKGPHTALHGGRHIKAIAKYISSKFGKTTPLEKIQATGVAKEEVDPTEKKAHTEKKAATTTSKVATMKAMSAKIHCKRTACARKAERLSKAQERNHKFTVSEKKAKAEMKEAKRDKALHAKSMEIHRKKHESLNKLAKTKAKRFAMAREKMQKLAAKEVLAKKEMKEAKKAKEEHAKTLENHEKRNAVLKKLAQKKLARVKAALEKSRKLTKRESITKMEVKRAYLSAKKAKNKDADISDN